MTYPLPSYQSFSPTIYVALAKSLAGHIKDVTSSEGICPADGPVGAFDGMGGNMDLTNDMNNSIIDATSSSSSMMASTTRSGLPTDTTISHPPRMTGNPLSSDPSTKKSPNLPHVALVSAPGTGWGLVDADGSEEGYGVVGLEPTMVDLLDTETLGHHR